MTDSSNRIHIGFDIGSISINTVVMDNGREIIGNRYDHCHGKPFPLLRSLLDHLEVTYSRENIGTIGFTGTGGELAAKLVGGKYVNEIIAQSTAVAALYPEVKTIIEMGGEDSKLIFMEETDRKGSRLSDFSLNTLCAAGTGSFLDQQAKRIGISIEEFGDVSLQSKSPPRIAGRCSVFAKSDMIHLQQIATPVHDILAGLCFAVARNFISTLVKGKSVEFPAIFQGGVAANSGMVRAFRELLQAGERDLIIPGYHASMGAIGALYHLFDESSVSIDPYKGINALNAYIEGEKTRGKTLQPLHKPSVQFNKEVYPIPRGNMNYEVYLGLDIGSLSTNVVLIDEENKVIARRYLPTASKPLEAIRQGMNEIFEEVGDRVIVKAAGTTGSGRYLTGDFVGADLIRNEITAQATAAIAYDPGVDTIFEIGGQDSKYISIDNGVVVDFEMNKVCAAGTGSFLEEQAEKLNIHIIGEFGKLALGAGKPAGLGDRCTVFMESDLNAFQQRGVETDNLVGGLAYSIVQNYIQKVVRKKRIGNHILFQGGVANNPAVVAAFEKVTGKKINIPPHFDVTGAIGAAMLARDYVRKHNLTTRFKGFDVGRIPYKVGKFTCKACSNHCEIRRVKITGEQKPLFYGGRCERYELDERKGKGEGIPNYFTERMEMLRDGYHQQPPSKNKKTIGIPRGLMIYYQQFPFWRTFFEALGFRVVVSETTSNQTVKKALGLVAAETCFPVEVMHGHVYELLDNEEVDYVFTPFIINAKAGPENPTSNYNCPWVQTFPFMINASVDPGRRDKLLIPALNFRYSGKVTAGELHRYFGKKFGISEKRIVHAMQLADEKQSAFERKLYERGKEILSNLPDDKECMVIVGRPYNTGDPALNLDIVEKLINLDVVPIPMDYLPLDREIITRYYGKMYWPNGQGVLAAARFISEHPKLHAIYMGNFRCGPDSFLSHFFNEEMAGKPYLEIEIDEHSADAGMITRYEAFLDSIKGSPHGEDGSAAINRPGESPHSPMKGKVLYFPYMSDASYIIAAVCRSFGIRSEALPMQCQDDLEIARKYTSGRECFPMICTTGSFLKKLMEPGTDPANVSFFMPDHNGPCRFGQYNKFQRVLFDRLGFGKAEIISPANDNSYEDISGGHGISLRLNIWKSFVAFDILRKFKQEHKPYELISGNTDRVYREGLDRLVSCFENGGRNIPEILENIGRSFHEIPISNGKRKPVIAVLGEIFMRDNAFCNGFLVDRLEKSGAETWMAGLSEWLVYSTIRYHRDSKWKGDYRGVLKSKIQELSQDISASRMIKRVRHLYDHHLEVSVREMLESCGPYIHRHYDGDPAPNLGTSVILAKRGISGIANIEPFTCMPGTVVNALSNRFRRDHHNIPMVGIAYDGQEDASIELRLQAFMHQAYQYRDRKGFTEFNQVLAGHFERG